MKGITSLSFYFLFALVSTYIPASSNAQVLLNADGPGNTYELINSVLAPGYDVVETPECIHPSFGRHIAEVWDADLGIYVFEFYIHVNPDNDRCINFDRQRVEIKTYDQSPANLIGTTGETVTYKWRFKLPVGFKPSSSFTHIHQVKAVGGDEDLPLFTLTARKGSPNKLELIYTADSATAGVKPVIVNLSLFEGVWVEATEVIKVGVNGTYYINIKRVSDGVTILTYNNGNIKTIRPGNSFIRPKWGIYRSLNTPADLRNDSIRFNNFSIGEGAANSQTYYWIGGTTVKSFTDNSNWNTQLDGNGTVRAAAAAEDILIFDGSNIGGTTPTVDTVNVTVTSTSLARLSLKNNVVVIMQRPPATGGTGTMTINGDGTPAPDFEVTAGSSLTINSPLADGNINIALSAGVTGLVGGTITLSNTGTHRITSQTLNGLEFSTGAIFNSDGTPSSAAYPFGSSSQAVQYGVIFQPGANLIVTGNRSPMGNSSTFQACNMLAQSNYYARSSNTTGTGSYTNLKTYGNIFIQNGATFTADGPFYKIDNLTIDNGCSLITHTSGHTPVLGNLTVHGSLTAPGGSTNILVLGGNGTQIISGNGTITVPLFNIPNYSDVSVLKNITVSSSANIYGKIDFSTSGQISGTGTFTSRVAGTATAVTGNTTAGSYLITGVVGTLSGNTGLAVTGAGLDANTNVTGFSSSNAIIYLSKPAISTTNASSFTFISDSATLVTANPNGMDSLNGSVTITGSKSFQAGTNYIINGPTQWPFGISSSSPAQLILGKVIINASVTTNYHVKVRGGFTLNAGNFTIRPVDTFNVISYYDNRYFKELKKYLNTNSWVAVNAANQLQEIGKAVFNPPGNENTTRSWPVSFQHPKNIFFEAILNRNKYLKRSFFFIQQDRS